MTGMRRFFGSLLVLSLVGLPLLAEAPKSKRAAAARSLAADDLNPQQARRVFAAISAQPDIAFHIPHEGCYARAHLMVEQLKTLGLRPGKIWAFANPDPLYARTKRDPQGFVEWEWHVAATVRVQFPDGKVEIMVLDPALFSQPVTIAKWKSAQKRTPTSREPFVTYTVPGEPPTLPTGRKAPGSGYWISGDPAEGVDLHARTTMRTLRPPDGRGQPGW